MINSSQPEYFAGRAIGGTVGTFVPEIICASLYVISWRLFRRFTSTPSVEILENDRRTPILFLRSFEDEKVKFKSGMFGTKTYFEEAIASAAWNFGPVIAIGKPGEKLPRFGACREYCDEKKWQNRIIELFSTTNTILFIIGLTDGLNWEISQLRNSGKIRNCIFLLPPLSRNQTLQRLKKISTQLPELVGLFSIEQNVLHNIRAIVFESNETPILFISKNATPEKYNLIIQAIFFKK